VKTGQSGAKEASVVKEANAAKEASVVKEANVAKEAIVVREASAHAAATRTENEQ
jgi:hypothetical protein